MGRNRYGLSLPYGMQLTFWMHLWSVRSCSKVGLSLVATVPVLYDPSGKEGPTISLQVLARNLCTPSIPPVLHVLESLIKRKRANIGIR